MSVWIRRLFLVLPFILPFAIHYFYQPINERWTVKRFGCGCPPVRGEAGFNANHFNLILWGLAFVVAAAAWWTIFRLNFTRRESKWYAIAIAVGLGVLSCICASQLAAEIWL